MADDAPHVANGGRKEFISSGDETCIRAGSLRAMISGSPNIAQASPNPSEAGEKPSSVIAPVDYSIAVDPIKYVGVPSSFDDFKPDSNIVDNDGVPGKPSLPTGSVFRSFSHLMILSFGRG